jgi:hypothetical protein
MKKMTTTISMGVLALAAQVSVAMADNNSVNFIQEGEQLSLSLQQEGNGNLFEGSQAGVGQGAFPICQRASNESGVIASHSVQRFGHRSH